MPFVLSVTFSNPRCPVCDQEHAPYQCCAFKCWTVDRSKGLARKCKVCFNCLGLGHGTASCPSRRGCHHRGERHNLLLHLHPASISSIAPATPTTMPAVNPDPHMTIPTTSVAQPLVLKVDGDTSAKTHSMYSLNDMLLLGYFLATSVLRRVIKTYIPCRYRRLLC